MATMFDQKNPWCNFVMMVTFMEVKGHIRGQMWQTMRYGYHAGQKNHWCKLKMIKTFMEIKGQI